MELTLNGSVQSDQKKLTNVKVKLRLRLTIVKGNYRKS